MKINPDFPPARSLAMEKEPRGSIALRHDPKSEVPLRTLQEILQEPARTAEPTHYHGTTVVPRFFGDPCNTAAVGIKPQTWRKFPGDNLDTVKVPLSGALAANT